MLKSLLCNIPVSLLTIVYLNYALLNTINYEVFHVVSEWHGMLLDFCLFLSYVLLSASSQEAGRYKTISINWIASEFFHFWKLPSPTKKPALDELDVPTGFDFLRDLSGRSSGSWVRTSPRAGTGLEGGGGHLKPGTQMSCEKNSNKLPLTTDWNLHAPACTSAMFKNKPVHSLLVIRTKYLALQECLPVHYSFS